MPFDLLFDFFLGAAPLPDTHLYDLYYLARLLIGIIVFLELFSLFRMGRKLIFGKK